MPDMRIQDLNAIDSLNREDLLPVAVAGNGYNAGKITAAQLTAFVEGVAQPYVAAAEEAASQAANSASSAEQSVSAIGDSVEAAKAAQTASETARDEAVSAGSGIEEKVTRAEVAAQTATDKAGQAATSEENAALSAGSAESAKSAAEAARSAAETAKDTAVSSAAQSSQDAQSASQSAQNAQESMEGAETARQAIENLGVTATTLDPGSPATVQKTAENGVVNLTFGLPAGDKGVKGDPGNSMESIRRVSGTSAPGTKDTYEIVLTDGSAGGQFEVYNGADGNGAGDMTRAIYDPQNKNADVFAYADQALSSAKEYTDSVVGDISAALDAINGEVV